jgi:hypothetical protein
MAMRSISVSEEVLMASVFDLLDEIRKRPTMYVGYDESKRAMQLRALEMLMDGYSLALRNHHIQERVADFNREFGTYLWEVKGWSASCGPVVAILEVTKSEAEAWELFWRMVEEFRRTVDTA